MHSVPFYYHVLIILVIFLHVSFCLDGNLCIFSFQVIYDGEDIPLPFNLDILKWADETQKVLSHAKVPPGVKFYNIYGISLETPHTVW